MAIGTTLRGGLSDGSGHDTTAARPAAAAEPRRAAAPPAAGRRTPCAPVRDLLPPGDVDAAYQVQLANVGERIAAGARVVGRKIGLTNPAVQAPARRRPARLRRAVRRHGLPAGRARSTSAACCSRGSRPRSRSCSAADLDDRVDRAADVAAATGQVVRGAGDRRQPHRRLGHHHRRHGRRQRLVRAVRARRPTRPLGDLDLRRLRHDDAARRRGRLRPGAAPPAWATRWPRWPGWRAPRRDYGAAAAGRRDHPVRRARPDGRRAPGRRVHGRRSTGSGSRRRFAGRACRMSHDQGRDHRSGNIGTDLMIKIMRLSSDARGRARWSASTRPPTGWPGAAGSGVADDLRRRRRPHRAWPASTRSRIVFDATSAGRAPRQRGAARAATASS